MGIHSLLIPMEYVEIVQVLVYEVSSRLVTSMVHEGD